MQQVKSSFLSKQNLIHIALSIFMLVIFFVVYIGIMLIIPQFAETSRAFISEVPTASQFLYDNYMYYPYLFYMAKITFILYFINVLRSGTDTSLFKKISISNLVVCVIVIVTTLISLYWPIIKMGSVV